MVITTETWTLESVERGGLPKQRGYRFSSRGERFSFVREADRPHKRVALFTPDRNQGMGKKTAVCALRVPT